jgi:bifunctional oligoribonuclease and PAP phosphatase NrnA
LRALGKDAIVYCKDGVPYNLKFLPGADIVVSEVPDLSQFSAVIVCDVSELERVSKPFAAATLASPTPRIIIDHHLTGAAPSELTVNDPNASATGEMIYDLAQVMGAPLTLDAATNLYAAVVSDTGSFRYSNTTPRIMGIAAGLLSLGVDPWEMTCRLYEDQPFERIRLIGAALETIEVSKCGRFASISLTQKMFDDTGANEDMTDGLINYARSIHGVEVAISFRETNEGLIKMSFRSRGTINVAELASRFGGGGHHNAAGARLEGRLVDVKPKIYAEVERALDEMDARSAEATRQAEEARILAAQLAHPGSLPGTEPNPQPHA